ncbi:DUF4132 domain-containing protein [Kibdelosporangium lantanae]|uniref:DUF4132 domain-containing protein n=1 Tax=Kibdelosporangium lantanae TaxID=1497396 RepID=A0ABW3M3S1_9PSEU
MTWLDASGGYQVRLDDRGKVVCRNAKGKQLATVPAALKEDGQVVQLRQLAEWLGRHETECHETVDRWMVRSLPVPTVVVVEVWPDPAWRNALRDLVVTVDDTAVFRRHIRVITAVWGTGFTVDTFVSAALAYTLPINAIPVASTAQWLVVLGCLILFHVWYVNKHGLKV